MSDISPLIRLFVSSTFADFGLERDVLQRMVFPRLRQLCEAQGCRFQPIDLRWGVSEEAGNEKRTLTICFEEIRRCQQVSPDLNFLILLGDRYGSCFLSATIPSTQVARLLPHLNTEERDIFRDAYREDLNALPPEYVLLPNTAGGRNDEQLRMALGRAARAAGFSPDEVLPFMASATHLEIQRGLLAAGADPAAVVCALRSFTSTPAGNDASGYVEQDSARSAQVESLKHAVEERLEGRLQRYVVPWGANGPVLDREALARQLLDLLEPRVREALARRQAAAQTRDPVGEANSQFAATRASVLVGREDALATVAAYLSNQLPLPLVVTGASGMGKSSLLARAVEDVTRTHPNAVVVTRYIGVTPGTGSPYDLLSGLRREIAQRYRQPVPEPLSDLSQVVEAVAQQLGTLEISAERPLFLFIDALDQLGLQRQRLDWLPRMLAPNVRVVLSILSDRPELEDLRAWMPEGRGLRLDPLTRAQGAKVLHAWLAHEGRQLTPNQEAAVLDGFAPAPQERGTPLYLRLAFEQARAWRSFDAVNPLPLTVSTLIQAYFEGLEKPGRHGREMVAYALGDVAAAKHGLAEDELLDLLPRNSTVRDALRLLNPDAPPIDDQQPLPGVLWARLHADLDRYLTEREAGGARLVTFYHRQVRDEAERRYLGGTEGKARHAELAAYFSDFAKQPYRLGDGTTGVWNRRKLAELAYQQAEAGAEARAALMTTLTDLRFLEGKVTAEGIAATLDDLAFAPEDADIRKIETAIRAGAVVLSRVPAEVLNQITGRVGPVASLHDLERRTPWFRLRSQSLSGDPTLVRILQGHTDKVIGCALSGDGQIGLSVSKDRTLQLWDTGKGEIVRTLETQAHDFAGCALSADGRVALSAYSDARLCVWDTATGRMKCTLAGQEGEELFGYALSGDGRVGLAALERGGSDLRSDIEDRLLLWDTTTGTIVRTLEGQRGIVRGCALSADGRVAMTASPFPSTLSLWDTASGTIVNTLAVREGVIGRVALSGNGKVALFFCKTLTGKRSLQAWDSSGGSPRVLVGHVEDVTACALSDDGRIALTSSEDRTLRLWDTTTGQTLRILRGHPGEVLHCALSPDGHFAFSAGDDHTLRLWNIHASQTSDASIVFSGPIIDCALSADGTVAVSASVRSVRSESFRGPAVLNIGMLTIWDATTGRPRLYLRNQRGYMTTCALSADGRRAITLSLDSRYDELRLLDTASGRTLRTEGGWFKKPLGEVALSADGRLALTPSGSKLRLWDTESGRTLRKLIYRNGSSATLPGWHTLSADGRLALTAFEDGTLRVWDIAYGTIVRTFEGVADNPHLCALSPDGQVVLAAGSFKTLRAWKAATAQMRHGVAGGVGAGHALRVWDAATWQMRGALDGVTKGMQACALSAQGRLALAAFEDGTLRLWDTASGQEIARWTHESSLRVCSLSWSGQLAMVGDAAGRVHFLEVVGVDAEAEAFTAKLPTSWSAGIAQRKPSILRRLFGRR